MKTFTMHILFVWTLILSGIPGPLMYSYAANISDTVVVIDTAPLAAPLQNTADTAVDSIVMEGVVVDRESGLTPQDTGIVITVDSVACRPDTTGSFTVKIRSRPVYVITASARLYKPASQTVAAVAGRRNYFVTLMLEKGMNVAPVDTGASLQESSRIPWVLSGAIIDSRLDLAIESDSTLLTFDGDTVPRTKKGNFVVSTRRGGNHVFHLRIPGYHEVYQTVRLDPAVKQPFIVIPTTVVSRAITRREITVTATAEPVHATATAGEIPLARKNLQRTAATFNDPIRVTQTLPGVASQSDASARPIVRGGPALEARVFLDGITLIQPYHFGGVRSIFNQMAVDNMTFYKTGFPAEFHNAQSAVISVQSRIPGNEPLALELDINPLQYSGYVGIPLFGGVVGVNASAQGSYYDIMNRAIMNIMGNVSGDPSLNEMAKLINLPDYQDFSGGISVKPGNKFQFFVNEVHNTDRMRFCTGDSVRQIAYYYYGRDSLGRRALDTIVYREESGAYYDAPSHIPSYWQPLEGRSYDSVSAGRPYYDVDTMLNYASLYNLLYGTARYVHDESNVVNVTAAWQRRRWDLDFPLQEGGADTNMYDVKLDQYNINAGWHGSGIDNHLLKAGIQVDYTRSTFNVYTLRMLHELIMNGSTNLVDFWGPMNGDTGMILDAMNFSGLGAYLNHIYVRYAGSRNWVDVSLYGNDSWTVSPKLTVDLGMRIEGSLADTSLGLSPRVSARYALHPDHELITSAGHYTQNNHGVAALALCRDLSPEKVWHAGIGAESRLLPWLTQKVDIYGKYYYDLLSEVIEPSTVPIDSVIFDYIKRNYYHPDSLSSQEQTRLYQNALFDLTGYNTRYTNKGRGYAYGIEYFLRYEPFDFWNGWISLSWGRSLRQRAPGWRWHPFPLERPLLLSLVNYYRLPRKYEISVKYRYMSGIPYTSITQNDDAINIGAFNDARYAAYQRLDFKIAKGLSIAGSKGHFYIEIWNAMNAPNTFLQDSKTQVFQTVDLNLPVTTLFVGLDFALQGGR